MKTPEIDKLISTLEYQVNIELFTTPKKVELLEELKKLKEVKKCSVLDDVISCLPSDVEISDYSKQKYLYIKSPCGTYYEGKQKGFYEGAEWLKDKLNNL